MFGTVGVGARKKPVVPSERIPTSHSNPSFLSEDDLRPVMDDEAKVLLSNGFGKRGCLQKKAGSNSDGSRNKCIYATLGRKPVPQKQVWMCPQFQLRAILGEPNIFQPILFLLGNFTGASDWMLPQSVGTSQVQVHHVASPGPLLASQIMFLSRPGSPQPVVDLFTRCHLCTSQPWTSRPGRSRMLEVRRIWSKYLESQCTPGKLGRLTRVETTAPMFRGSNGSTPGRCHALKVTKKRTQVKEGPQVKP